MLTRVEDIIPKWKIVPTKDVIDSTFKDPVKREEVNYHYCICEDKWRFIFTYSSYILNIVDTWKQADLSRQAQAKNCAGNAQN